MSQPIQALNILGSAPSAADQSAPEAASAVDAPIHDIVIIGSGPAGYTAAIYAARAEMAPLVIAGALDAGGALMTTTEVENFPGFAAGIQGPDLMTTMQEQAERFGAEVLFEDAVTVDLEGELKSVTLEDGTVHRARALIIATGSAYRKLGVEGEERLSGKGVSWCATCDGFFFKDEPIVVVGGGDSAVEEATFLTRYATGVTPGASPRPAASLEDHGPTGRSGSEARLRVERRGREHQRRGEGGVRDAARHGHGRTARVADVRRVRGDRACAAFRAFPRSSRL